MLNTVTSLERSIQEIWNNIEKYCNNAQNTAHAHSVLERVTKLLNDGTIRACNYQISQDGNFWQTNLWVKQAILLIFKLSQNQIFQLGAINCYDKIQPRFSANFTDEQFQTIQARITPTSYVRDGVFLGKNVVIMPSFINIGAYIDNKTMIDSMVTIGSCVQIGKNCHISSGVTIGGVLEPISERPVIIEDDCFIGAGSQISEGMLIQIGSVIGSGVVLTSRTKIYDRITKQVTYNSIPPYSVVVPGMMPMTDPDQPGLLCAVIVKKVDALTRSKTSINDILRINI